MKVQLLIYQFFIFFFILPIAANLIPNNCAASDIINKTIYREDKRLNLHEVTIPQIKTWARSTAAMIPTYWFEKPEDFDGMRFDLMPSNLDVCSWERFSEQTAVAECTGFLVGPDVLVTAGHCAPTKKICEDYYWVFDFKLKEDGTNPRYFLHDQIYSCKELIYSSLYYPTPDIAVIRLDREVVDRAPLTFRDVDKVADNANLVVIGHPSGLPSKVSLSGTIVDNTNPQFFTAHVDTFSGNSGSPVFDLTSGLVEGVLVRGNRDYVLNTEHRCFEAFVCLDQNNCTASESVQRISVIRKKI
ncbi:MAG: trypsin-like peptidase domain-containing protein [Bacteriovoracaceae bacterium]|nr:trypsin-like peptidase domain-containing protein [Bacteriovoracaceae bacterium]